MAKTKTPAKGRAAPKAKTAKPKKAKDGWTKIPGDTPVDEVIRIATGKKAVKPVSDQNANSSNPEQPQANKPWLFQKGQSGNPGGRPRVVGDIKKLAREHTELALKALIDVAGNSEAPPAARVSAATALLNRGYGMPVQQMEVGKPGDFSQMSDEDVDAFIKEAAAELSAAHAMGELADGAMVN